MSRASTSPWGACSRRHCCAQYPFAAGLARLAARGAPRRVAAAANGDLGGGESIAAAAVACCDWAEMAAGATDLADSGDEEEGSDYDEGVGDGEQRTRVGDEGGLLVGELRL